MAWAIGLGSRHEAAFLEIAAMLLTIFTVSEHPGITILIGGAVLVFLFAIIVRHLLNRTEKRFREHLESRKLPSPIGTESPLEHPKRKARDRGKESLRYRFSIIRQALAIFTFLVVAAAVSIPFVGALSAAMLSLFLAVTGIIVGIAAKPLLENLFSGIVLTFSGCIRIGDTVVIKDQYGTIEDIQFAYTVVKLWNWRRLVIPNHLMSSTEFFNLTLYDTYQWVHVEFWVAPGADLTLVKEKALEVAVKSDHFSDHEPPRFWIMEMGKEGIRCWIAAWGDTPKDCWELSHDIRTLLAEELQLLEIHPHDFRISTGSFEKQILQAS